MRMNGAKFQALRQGALFGIPLGVLLILNEVFLPVFDSGAFSFPLAAGGFIQTGVFCLFTYIFAGWRASYVTGKISTGMAAGLVTGVLSSIINGSGVLVIWLTHIDTSAWEVQTGSAVKFTNDRILSQRIAELIAGLALAVVFGLVCGAFGGKIGKERKRLAQTPAVQTS
jgi:hypothetical protein